MRFHAMVGEFSVADRTRKTFTIRGLAGYKFLLEKKDEIEKDFQDAALAFIDYCKVAGTTQSLVWKGFTKKCCILTTMK